MIDPQLLYGLAGLAVGGLLMWFWRGAEVGQLRGSQSSLREQLQEHEVALASRSSEYDMLDDQLRDLRHRSQRLEQERNDLSTAHAALKAEQAVQREQHREQLVLLEESKRQLATEFENLAHRIFEQRGKELNSQNLRSVESLLKPFGEQIHRFQARINEVHEQSIRGHESLSVELRNLLGIGMKMSDQAENLATALKGDKKTTGNWGEVQLERTLQLAGLEEGVHYESQAAFRDSAGKLRIPDFVIKLPDGKHLVVDSKVSLVDYDRAVSAESEEERDEALKAHAQAIRRHIDELSNKDYSALSGMDSPELVFMFMPIEAAYIEALKYNRDLFNEGYRKNVILVSHTTLLPMLRTVASLWIAYRSNQEAREISEMAGEIYNKVCLVGQRLEDMGKTLSTATDKYNRTVTALVGRQGLFGKVERFRSISSNAKGELPTPSEQYPSIEHDRLTALGEGAVAHLTAVEADNKNSST